MKKKYWRKTNLFLVTILLWKKILTKNKFVFSHYPFVKKILTKNKFVFSHYPFMKKNTDEKQICF